MNKPVPEWAPLKYAEHFLLQVLLSKFTLYRHATGVHLDIAFDTDTPAIWTQRQKPYWQATLDKQKIATYQKRLNKILLENEPEPAWLYDDPGFPFRYASGGTLPIMTLGDRRYACLFYRESEPVGWNLANGASDSIYELVDPHAIMERELREELILISRGSKQRFVFDSGRSAFHLADFEFALRAWSKEIGEDLQGYEESSVEVSWHRGSDSVKIVDQHGTNFTHSGFFLNINARDHGIEFDQIAEFDAPRDDVLLLDGEVYSGRRLGRPVGLFNIDTLRNLSGRDSFVPDYLFIGAFKHGPLNAEEDCQDLIEKIFVSALEKKGLWGVPQTKNWRSLTTKLDLCPVTRLLLKRYFREVVQKGRDAEPVDSCFVSYSQDDSEFVDLLVSRLRGSGLQVWYAPHNLDAQIAMNIQIVEAIRQHDVVVLVASENSIDNEWVNTEIRTARDLELQENIGSKLIPVRLSPMERLRPWTLFDPDRGVDIALEIRQIFMRDFSNWRDPVAVAATYEKLLMDIRGRCASRRAAANALKQEV